MRHERPDDPCANAEAHCAWNGRQNGYHDHVICRHGGEYGRIAQYIAENPPKWR